MIAKELISRNVVRPGDVIVPAPQHSGNAEYTKKIAALVSKQTGATVADILHCVPHSPLYFQKKEGPQQKIDLTLYIKGVIPKGRCYFFLDNVISTGTTYSAANSLFNGTLKPLVYAVDTSKIEDIEANGLLVKESSLKKLADIKADRLKRGHERKTFSPALTARKARQSHAFY